MQAVAPYDLAVSAIAGILSLDQRPLEPGQAQAMVARLVERAAHVSDQRRKDELQLVQLERRPHPRPTTIGATRPTLWVTADARIDNCDELEQTLGKDAFGADLPRASRLILGAYRKWGTGCAQHLVGAFAFALWDSTHQRLYCARDVMGVRPFFYHHAAHRLFAFASEAKALLTLAAVDPEIDEERLADFLMLSESAASATFYRNVRALPPAHQIVVDHHGFCLERYWRPDLETELELGSDGDYEERFRACFFEAVRCRLGPPSPAQPSALGSTLSGGLDSSAVACAASRLLGDEPAPPTLHTFAAVFPSLPPSSLALIDERRYLEAAEQRIDGEHHRIEADRLSPTAEIDFFVGCIDGPHVPFNLYLHREIYRRAEEHGIVGLLDGLDGDTTVSHGIERLPELVRERRWLTLLSEARALARYSPNSKINTRSILYDHAVAPFLPTGVARRAATREADRLEALDLFEPDFTRRLRLEQRWLDSRSALWRRFIGARAEHARALESALHPQVLEIASSVAARSGVEPRYPFYDRRLIELCLSLPSDQKLRNGTSRSILRRALSDLLPSSIRSRMSKANLSPNFILGVRDSCAAPTCDLSEIYAYVDKTKLHQLQLRIEQTPLNIDTRRFFTVVCAGRWLQQRGTASFS